jgi:hypothetical protein
MVNVVIGAPRQTYTTLSHSWTRGQPLSFANACSTKAARGELWVSGRFDSGSLVGCVVCDALKLVVP